MSSIPPTPSGKPNRTKGRPPRLDQELIEKLCRLIEAGNYVETAVAHCNVPKSKYYEWIKKSHDPKQKQIYRDLRDAIEKAWANGEIRDVLAVGKSIEGGAWQAAAWRLERKFPKRWGRMERVEVSGPDAGPIEVKAGMDEQQVKAIAAALAAADD